VCQGVYVAGDVSRGVLLVSIAIAEGAKAAVAIDKAFLRRDGFATEVASLSRLNLLLGLGEPAPDTEHVDQEEDAVLDDQRYLVFKPAVGHSCERSCDEDHKTRDRNASIPVGGYERGCKNCRHRRKRS
jgi:hypothetical protein